MNLSVIVPVYNEAHHIIQVISAIQKVPIEKEIIVVDDCSTDGTREKLNGIKGIRSILHQYNMGKGAAIRSGLAVATGAYTIIQDADFEYSPTQYPRLLEPLKNGAVSVVYGSRFLGEGDFLFLSYYANRLLTLLTNILYGSHLSDMETCYKIVRTDFLRNLKLISTRFEIEPEITCKILKRGVKILEVPIFYKGRSKGKKIGPRDGIQAVWNLVKWKFKR